MAGTVAPNFIIQLFDNNGEPASGYLLFTYAAGTSTKQATYTDSDLSSTNTNPIVLDSSGRCTIYLSPTSYKFVLAPPTDTDPPASPVWTRDNVTSVPPSTADIDMTGTAGEDVLQNDVCFMSLGDGGNTAGRWYKADADLQYGSATAYVLGFPSENVDAGSTGTFKVAGRVTGLVGLTPGSVYYVSATSGELTATATSLAYRRRVGVADSSSTLIISHWTPDISRTIDRVVSSTGNVGSGEDTIASVTIPAATLYRNEHLVRFAFGGTTANNANAKTLKVRCIEGANNTVLCSFSLTVSEAGQWLMGGWIVRDAAATGRSMGQSCVGPSGGPLSAAITWVNSAVTVTWANSVEIRVTGEATDDDDIICTQGSVRLEEPPD